MNLQPTPLLSVRELSVHFKGTGKLVGSQPVKAVDGISFDVYQGETLGIAGESGSGKSTLARALIGINKPTSGKILVRGHEIVDFSNSALRPIRKKIQMVFQDPYDSLDPLFTISQSIAEGLQVRDLPRSEIPTEVLRLLETVKLPGSLATRYPKELSGGQRQRVAIARALATNPDLIICDEAVAALDVSVRAQILNLLQDIQEQASISFIFISHDLSTLRYISKSVAIMYAGKIIEYGDSDAVLTHPQHPYTRALVSAVPNIAGNNGDKIKSIGEPPDLANVPSGCAFNPRCRESVARCLIQTPQLLPTAQGPKVACHLIQPIESLQLSPGGEQRE
jgi:oligopeptide/dipeptide ABC transporter ATP-binding protein